MVRKIITKNLKWIFLILAVVFLTYSQIFLGFFQQDEWASFAVNSLLLENNILGYLKGVLNPTVGHYQPFNNFVLSILYTTFGLHYLGYASVSIFLHLLNVLLVFVLSIRVLKNTLLALFTSLLFGVSASTYQATSWVMADLGIHLSTLMALISIIFMLNYADTDKRKNLIISVTFLFFSLLFKEITFGLFLLLPISFFIFSNKKNKYKFKILYIFIFFGSLYLALRGAMYLLPSAYSLEESIVKIQSLFNIAYNLFTFPIKGFVESIIPVNLLLGIAYFISNFFYVDLVGQINTTKRDIVVQKWILELLVFVVFLSFPLFLIKFKDNFFKYKKALLLGIFLVILNAPIFAFSPEKSGKITIIDSRNLYFINIGSTLILAAIIASLFKKNLFIIVIYSILSFYNVAVLTQNLKLVNRDSEVRKKILERINIEYPNIPKKTIFFTSSDTSYYGLPEDEKILPFQSGFGQTLIVWFYIKGEIPKEYLKNKYLWEITSEGYKQVGEYGFGYFRDIEELKRVVKQYNIPKESIVGYEWKSKNSDLINISEEIREKI